MFSVIFRRGISRKINPKLTKIELTSFTKKSSEIKNHQKEKIKNVTKAKKDLFRVNAKKRTNKERRANYELISILKKRGIFKDIVLNGIGSQKIDLYLNKKSRSIFSILKLKDERLPFSSLSTLFPLFIVQQLGHRPVLILDDREALDENQSYVDIEQTIHDTLRIFKNHVDHFLMPQYHKSNRHLYDFHQIVILKMSNIILEEPNLKSFMRKHSELKLGMLDKTKSIHENYKSICQADDIRYINSILDSSTQISNEYDELSLDILEALEIPHKVITVKDIEILNSSQVFMNQNDTSLWEFYLYLRFALGKKPQTQSKEANFDKHAELYKLNLAYIPEIVNIINQNRDNFTETFVYQRRLIERLITLVHGKTGVESVRRMSRAHFNMTNMNFMSMITKAEQDQVFGSVDSFEWHSEGSHAP